MRTAEKRIVVNTLILYVRMLMVMGLSFFTTRILLRALGVDDFGLVNVLTSVVSMFAFVTSTFSTGCSRYYSFAIGRNDDEGLRRVFGLSLLLYGMVAAVLLVLFETVGLWYVNTRLVCDPSRVSAARIFYQLIIAQTLISWLSSPFNALLIAYENMTAFSLVSIADAVLRFAIAIVLGLSTADDRLVPYGWLLVAITVISLALTVAFVCFCHPTIRPMAVFCRWNADQSERRDNRSLFLSLCAFNGWRMTNVFSWTAGNVFVNLLLNAFFGPAVNASRAIAMQVQTGVRALNENFLTAVRPQFVKCYAAKDKASFDRLLIRSLVLSFVLVFVFAFPAFVFLEWILKFWLGTVPPYAVVFTRITLATVLVNSLIHPLNAAVHAVGEIKTYELTGALVFGLVWPLSYLALRLGFGPASTFWITLVLSFFANVAQFLIARKVIRGCGRV